jgi:hypothetical protein
MGERTSASHGAAVYAQPPAVGRIFKGSASVAARLLGRRCVEQGVAGLAVEGGEEGLA